MMAKPHDHRNSSGRTNLASCLVATIFLIFLVAVAFVVYFVVFKPKDPKISVSSVQLPAFSVATNTANFTFSQYAAVENPNRATFSHFDSSIQILYAGNQVGFMFIPAGKIDPGRTQYMAATFSVNSFPLSPPPDFPPMGVDSSGLGPGPLGAPAYGLGNGVGPTIEIESRTQMGGRVRVLHFFTHRLVAKSECRVTVSASDGSVLGFHC